MMDATPLSLHHAIFGAHEINNARLGLENMGSPEMQNICMVDHPK
jgi:hypothetical protein